MTLDKHHCWMKRAVWDRLWQLESTAAVWHWDYFPINGSNGWTTKTKEGWRIPEQKFIGTICRHKVGILILRGRYIDSVIRPRELSFYIQVTSLFFVIRCKSGQRLVPMLKQLLIVYIAELSIRRRDSEYLWNTSSFECCTLQFGFIPKFWFAFAVLLELLCIKWGSKWLNEE
jgi:hypothetical protein